MWKVQENLDIQMFWTQNLTQGITTLTCAGALELQFLTETQVCWCKTSRFTGLGEAGKNKELHLKAPEWESGS